MCLIAFAWRDHASLPLVFASNRDEFFDRPTAEACWWVDAPQVLAGRDLEAGGTWMGVTRHGRFAALTNFRAPNEKDPSAPSRGDLVADYLKGTAPPASYLEEVAARVAAGTRYNGFSLLAGDMHSAQLWLYSNRSGLPPQHLAPGVYGLSNALLDTPWPKLLAARDGLRLALEENTSDLPAHLMQTMANPAQASEFALPATGMSAELERQLSAVFIQPALRGIGHAAYGTRTSTILTISAAGHARLHERSFGADERFHDQTFEFSLEEMPSDT